MSYVEKIEGGSVNWGKVVAGAAVVTGAVLVAPSVMGKETLGEALKAIVERIGDGFEAIGTKIGALFTAAPEAAKEAVETAAEATPKEPGLISNIGAGLKAFGEWVWNNGKELSAAGLIGGGAAGFLASSGEKAYVVKQHPIQTPATHVENEQMRAINGLMKARMMAANPEYMAQAMGGRA